MTVDRKRLRELALASRRLRLMWPHEAPEDRVPFCDFTDLRHDEVILELLDALEAAEQPTDDARDAARYRWLRQFHIHGHHGDPDGKIAISAATDGLDYLIDAAIAEQAKERS